MPDVSLPAGSGGTSSSAGTSLTRRVFVTGTSSIGAVSALAWLSGCSSTAESVTTRAVGATAATTAAPAPSGGSPGTSAVVTSPTAQGGEAGATATAQPTPSAPAPSGAAPTGLRFVSDTSTPSRAALAAAVTRAIGPEMQECSVSVLDRRTGLAWQYRGDALVPTGSVSKALIVAQALRLARAEGRAFSATERSWAKAAITQSANGAASSLYSRIDGHRGVAALAADLGMTATATATPAEHWGATLVTSNDLVTMMTGFTDGSAVTHPDDDAYLLDLMGRVINGQRWGVGTVRSSSVSVRIKNGWMLVESPTWVINSVGDVSGDGRGYVLAILLRHQRSQEPSMARSSSISRAVYTALSEPLT